MIPFDLPRRRLCLPEAPHRSIVLFTQRDLRHRRFALRLQQEFGSRVIAWFEITPNAPTGEHLQTAKNAETGKWNRHIKKAGQIFAEARPVDVPRPQAGLRRVRKALTSRVSRFSLGLDAIRHAYTFSRKIRRVEHVLLAEEVAELEQYRVVEPQLVTDPFGKAFAEQIKDLYPYFLLSLGGPLVRRELLTMVRGVPINQHAGWAPTYKGNGTIYWALYHRDLAHLGATVHVTTADADAGPILRRGYPYLQPADSPESCFVRTVILGTELLIDVVHEAITTGELFAFDQQKEAGRTYLNRHCNAQLFRFLRRDFRSGWWNHELSRIRDFWE